MCLHSFPGRCTYIRRLSGNILHRRPRVRQQLIGSRGRIQGLLCMCLHSFPGRSPYIRRLSGNILHRRPHVRNLCGVGLGSSDDRRRGRTSDFLGDVPRTACYRTDPLLKPFWGRLYLIFEVFNLLAFFHFTPHKSVVGFWSQAGCERERCRNAWQSLPSSHYARQRVQAQCVMPSSRVM